MNLPQEEEKYLFDLIKKNELRLFDLSQTDANSCYNYS